MAIDSRMPGWYRLSVAERRRRLCDALWLDEARFLAATECGGLSLEAADQLVENVVGTYALPFAVATNFTINGRDVFVPMVIEEPSVVAAASNAAKMVRASGGFVAQADPPIMKAQVQVCVDDVEDAARRITENKEEILSLARAQDPKLCDLGGGPVDLEVRPFPWEGFLVIHLLVDVRDAMGANAVNTMAEAVAPLVESITSGRVVLRILTNLADRRLVRVTCRVRGQDMAPKGYDGEAVVGLVELASRLAEVDPYRAATHNKGIMNGIDAVLLATGNDFRAVEAGAHAYAARGGSYRPLCVWSAGEGDTLEGRLEVPMAVGIVGGATRVHPAARLALEIMGIEKAQGLAQVAASAGMANNLAALRALATEGIQKGHMRLHKRSRHLEKP